MNAGFELYGALMVIASFQAWRYARVRQFDVHRAWAIEILSAVEKHKKLDDAGRELIELARERGGPDNITVNILRLL